MKKVWPGRGLIWGFVVVLAIVCLLTIREADLASPGATLNYLGRATGILGLAMMLLAAALIARVPGFDRHFGGLTKLWKTHHLLGAGALLLLMAHPILLALAAAEISLAAAMGTLFPPLSSTGIWLGWAALALMMIFLAPSFSFFGRPEYQRWKWVHRLAGPAVILALAHILYFGRTLPADLDRALWAALALLAVGAVIWRFVFSRRLGSLRYEVAEVSPVGNNLVELTLKPGGKRRLAYQAGQFVYLTPYDRSLAAGYGEEHPYTVSSSPEEENLRIAIKDLGDASRAIQTIQPGSPVRIEGPYGDFFPVSEPGKPELWVAGGIGITPFLGRARHLAATGQSIDACLVYCVQDEARARFLDELKALADQIPGLVLIPHYFYREGPLNTGFLSKHCRGFGQRTVYVCGPEPLNRLIISLSRQAGVAMKDIHTEEFELL